MAKLGKFEIEEFKGFFEYTQNRQLVVGFLSEQSISF